MALNKDILGAAIYTVRKKYSSKTAPQLIAQYGSLDKAQLAMATDEAAAIIKHFTTLGNVQVAVTTTVVTTGTALAQTGTGVGNGVGKIQ